MTTAKPIKLFSEIRDLEIFDTEGELCGICDDVEFEGGPGQPLRIAALLVGPGAYRGRIPGWLAWIAHRVAGEGIVRVPWKRVAHVTSRITLDCTAAEAGLSAIDRRIAPILRKLPAG
jgi:sporulation protein YlmC with PRC-barrel domain